MILKISVAIICGLFHLFLNRMILSEVGEFTDGWGNRPSTRNTFLGDSMKVVFTGHWFLFPTISFLDELSQLLNISNIEVFFYFQIVGCLYLITKLWFKYYRG